MSKEILDLNLVAEDDLWEYMDTDAEFNDFIGKCITHFIHFVIPRRDQSREIFQDYEIPDKIDSVAESTVRLTRKDSSNQIYISFRE